MVVFYTFSSDKTINNREKMPLLCGFLHFAHGYIIYTRGGVSNVDIVGSMGQEINFTKILRKRRK